MNKEDILTEISNNLSDNKYFPSRSDCCDVEEQVFQDVVLDNIESYRITFCNCKFKNVQFLDNKIEWIEFEECEFENVVFSGNYENVLLTIMDSSFKQCEVRDFAFSGYSAQSEIVGCKFDSCCFTNIRVEADLSILGGEIKNSKGTNLLGKMNMIMRVKMSDSAVQKVDLEAAIIINTFHKTVFNNIKMKEESVVKENTFENCIMDNK